MNEKVHELTKPWHVKNSRNEKRFCLRRCCCENLHSTVKASGKHSHFVSYGVRRFRSIIRFLSTRCDDTHAANGGMKRVYAFADNEFQ